MSKNSPRRPGRWLTAAVMPTMLVACVSSAPTEPGRGDSALSPRHLTAFMPDALPPPGAGRPSGGVADASPAVPMSAEPPFQLADHAAVLSGIGSPPSPRQAMSMAAADAVISTPPHSPGGPAAVGSPLASLPGGEVGAGIRAGQCWAQLVMEPVTRRQTVAVVTEDGATRLRVLPPALRTQARAVVVKDAAQTFRVEPPTFRPVTERVKVQDEVRRPVVVPAVYESREERVQVESARVVLERCGASAQRAAGSGALPSRVAQCAREVPARFQTVTRRVLVQPESTREEVIPAVYATITRWVLDTPARTVPHTLPEATRNLPLTEVARPALVQAQAVPPTTMPMQVTQHEGMPQLVWRRALCESEAMPALVTRLQQALQGQGQDVGRPDGRLGRRTMAALVSYQRREGLAMGLITFESLQKLGLSTDSL